VQQDLFGSVDFVPIKHGTRHYVPVLQNRSGELTALATLAPGAWDHITPLIRIVGPKKPRPGRSTIEPTAESVRSWVKKIADVVADRPCYLDIVRLSPSLTMKANPKLASTKGSAKQQTVLDAIYSTARRRHLEFVPVLHVGTRQASHLRSVRDAVHLGGRGVALRYPLLGTISIATPAEAVLHTLTELGEAAERTDLFLDLEWLTPDSEVDLDLVGAMTRMLAEAAPWRNVVLLGTSIPSSLSCVPEGTVGSLPRREWSLWKALTQRVTDGRLVFGDYGIQHPKPPQDGGPGMRANIRYTVEDGTVVARGSGAVFIEGKEQYRDLCSKLVDHPEFLGGDFSWGDAQIRDCADGLLDPGSQTLWRAVGASHHLSFVSGQVRNLPR
jgi:hypothetical protein